MLELEWRTGTPKNPDFYFVALLYWYGGGGYDFCRWDRQATGHPLFKRFLWMSHAVASTKRQEIQGEVGGPLLSVADCGGLWRVLGLYLKHSPDFTIYAGTFVRC